MNTMRYIVICFLVLSSVALSGQDSYSLRDLIDSAMQNHPRSIDSAFLKEIHTNKMENYSSRWYPELNLNIQASYQSDVIEFDMDSPLPGLDFPVAPKDQYKVYMDVRQNIYDGGRVRKMKEAEQMSLSASLLDHRITLENIKSDISSLYFNLLLLQENSSIISITLEQIKRNLGILQAAVDNGIALQSDVDLLKVEKLELEQDLRNLDERKQSLTGVLDLITGIDFAPDAVFSGSALDFYGNEINRTELEVLASRKNLVDLSSELAASSRLPAVFAFGQLGYGNPGLNMINDAFDSYYLVGVGLKWNIWDWGNISREKNNYEYQRKLLETREQELIQKIRRGQLNYLAEIRTHEGNIEKYGQILEIREGITRSYQDKLAGGTIRTIDYLEVVNQEKVVRLKLSAEKILLQKAIADHALVSGNLNFNDN